MSPNTVKRVHNDLRHFFRWCVEEGYLKEVPTFPRTNGEQSRRPHFDEREWRKINHYVLSRNMGTSVKMLEDYYGHTSNVTMSDELTKSKQRTKKITKGKTEKVDPTFGWLKSMGTPETEPKPKVRRTTKSKSETTEPTYVDLVTE